MMSPMLSRLTPVALALALAGCAIGPDFLRPDALLPASFGEATPAQPAEKSEAVDPRWWALFKDPVLDDLVTQALANNADVRQAVARVEQAEAAAREAGAALFPEIDGGVATSSSKASTKTSTFFAGQPTIRHANSAALSTSYEMDVWGRVRRTTEASRASLLASEYGQDAIRLSVAGLVAGNYLTLRALDAQLTVTDETVKTREQSLKLVKMRVDAGFASPIDLFQSEGSLAQAQAQQADLRRQRALAEHQIALVTGNPGLKIAPGDLAHLPLPPLPPAGLPSDLIDGRPDVRQAEAQLIAANAQIGIARAGYFPRFTLTGSVGSESKTLSDLFSAGAGTWALGLNLLMPILDFGRTTARVDQAKALNQQSLVAWQNTLQTAYKEVRDALVNLRENGEAETAQTTRVDRARKALELSQVRYQAGYVGYLEVLDAQRTLYDAQLAAIAVRQARLNSAVGLFKALGGGWKAGPGPA